MKLTIVQSDNVVTIDGVSQNFDYKALIDPTYFAVQWEDTTGHIQIKYQHNIIIDNIDEFQSIIDQYYLNQSSVNHAIQINNQDVSVYFKDGTSETQTGDYCVANDILFTPLDQPSDEENLVTNQASISRSIKDTDTLTTPDINDMLDTTQKADLLTYRADGVTYIASTVSDSLAMPLPTTALNNAIAIVGGTLPQVAYTGPTEYDQDAVSGGENLTYSLTRFESGPGQYKWNFNVPTNNKDYNIQFRTYDKYGVIISDTGAITYGGGFYGAEQIDSSNGKTKIIFQIWGSDGDFAPLSGLQEFNTNIDEITDTITVREVE